MLKLPIAFTMPVNKGFEIFFDGVNTFFYFNGRAVKMESVLSNRGYETYKCFTDWRDATIHTLLESDERKDGLGNPELNTGDIFFTNR